MTGQNGRYGLVEEMTGASRWFEVFIKECDSSGDDDDDDDDGNYPSINSPVRRFLYDLTLSGLLNQACLCSAKPSCSGVGITGIIPIEMVTWPGIASSVEKIGLGKVSTSAYPASPRETCFPSTAQNHRCTGFPLLVALSSKSFNVPSLS
jgi:hypothetical protein